MTASSIAQVALLVCDYDEAIAFFVGALRFRLVEDRAMDAAKRWVVVAPPGSGGTSLLLAKASTDEQRACIGRQGGGRVFLFLETDDFDDVYRHMQAQGVRFMEAPRHEPYGTVAVFEDVCGNRWDLIQRK